MAVDPFSASWWWLVPLEPKRGGDLALLCCCFVTGVIDTCSFLNFGVFTAMQTGNTVILCLSAAGLPAEQPYAYASTLISITSFVFGVLATTRVCSSLGSHRRLVLATNFLCQGLLILLTAALATVGIVVTEKNINWTPSSSSLSQKQLEQERRLAVFSDARILIGLAPLAFQSGATIATSRLLGFGQEIPVVVYTSTYAALAGDLKLFQLHGNKPRNIRLAAVVCVFAGALCAGWIERKSIGMVACLWIGAGIKMVLAVAVAAFMRPKEDDQDSS